MAISNDVQKLEPGTKIRLIHIDASKFGAGHLYFHCNNIPHTDAEIKAAGGDEKKLKAKSIFFDYMRDEFGNLKHPLEAIEYSAWPFELTGISSSSDGQTAEPVLKVANLDGSITSLCLHFEDMVQARVEIIDTFAHYLNGENFPLGNKTADPSQCYKQLWYIDSKTSEDNEVIEFKLASPLDLQGQLIPTRQITALCTWACRDQYRQDGCNYQGTNYFNLKGEPISKESYLKDPGLDKCSGLLEDCKARWGKNAELPFGGFPGAALMRQ